MCNSASIFILVCYFSLRHQNKKKEPVDLRKILLIFQRKSSFSSTTNFVIKKACSPQTTFEEIMKFETLNTNCRVEALSKEIMRDYFGYYDLLCRQVATHN